MKLLKSTKYLATAILLLTIFSACKKTDSGKESVLKLRLINSFRGSVDLDFYQELKKLNSTAVSYGGSPVLVEALSGYKAIAFNNAGTNIVNAGLNISIPGNTVFSVFYAKLASGEPQILGYQDELSAPTVNSIKVRFINLGSSFKNGITVTNNIGKAYAINLSFMNNTEYFTVDVGTVIKLTIPNSDNPGTIISSSLFKGGKIYTVWFDEDLAGNVEGHVVEQN